MSFVSQHRRRVHISSSSEDDGENAGGGFLSEDDDERVEDSDPDSTDLHSSKRESNQSSGGKSSDGSDASLNNKDSERMSSRNKSHQSIVSSTPISRTDSPQFTFGDKDADLSSIFSESVQNLSVEDLPVSAGTEISEEEKLLDGDRSRSFREPKLADGSNDVCSPISKRLSSQNDAASRQKLRERILRKSVQQTVETSTPKRQSTGKLARDLHLSPITHSKATAQSSDSPMCTQSNLSSASPLQPAVSSFMTPRKPVIVDSSGSENDYEEEECLDETVPLDESSVDDKVSASEGEEEDEQQIEETSYAQERSFSDGEPSIVCLSSDDEKEKENEEGDSMPALSAMSSGRGDEVQFIRTSPAVRNPQAGQQSKELPEHLKKFADFSVGELMAKRSLSEKALSRASSLPDGGARLREQLEMMNDVIEFKKAAGRPVKKEIEVVNVVPAPGHDEADAGDSNDVQVPSRPVSLATVSSSLNQPKKPITIDPPQFNPEQYNRLLNNDKKRLFGGKMTDSRIHDVKRVTEQSLKGMHKALTTVPEESQMVDTPKGLKVELMSHQKQGLAWLTWRETQTPPGGILADDMGLGKTLSTIALVVHQKNERLKRKEDGTDEEDRKRRQIARSNGLYPSHATLVVAPASLIYQWQAEVEKRVKSDRLSVYVFHGPKNKRESDPKRLARYDLVITTFNLVTTELTEKVTTGHKGDSDDSEDDSADEMDNWGEQAGVSKQKKKKNKISKHSDSVLAKIAWDRIVLDEAHQIKNRKSGASRAACNLAGNARWCLTGTPIHNNLWDFYSLIRFLRVSPFDEERHWKEYIMCSTQKAADRLNLLTKNLLLRRTKTQICNITKKPLVDLQPKVLTVHELELAGTEAQVYDIMFTATQQKVKQMLSEEENAKHVEKFGFCRKKRAEKGQEVVNPFNFGPRKITEGDRFQQMSCMLVMLLRLRQACVHMFLTKNAVDMDAFDCLGGEGKEGVDVLEKTMADMSLSESIVDDVKEAASQIFEKEFLSCKVKKLMEIIDDCMEKEDKIVVVSQWTSLLDIVEDQLTSKRYSYTSITGKVLPGDRQERVDSFNKEHGGANIMLLSLTAGGVGLNLVGGNHLVMVDLHWNPALEAQACDRIYRMGQKKTVYIHRLVTQGTIEQRVLDLQTKKLELAGSVLEGAASKKMNKLTMNDLKYLFDLEPKKVDQPPPVSVARPTDSAGALFRNPMVPAPLQKPGSY